METKTFFPSQEELEDIAKEVVKRKEKLEFLEDVDVRSVKRENQAGEFYYEVKGKAKKRITNQTNNYEYDEELSFTLQIYQGDRVYYQSNEWVRKKSKGTNQTTETKPPKYGEKSQEYKPEPEVAMCPICNSPMIISDISPLNQMCSNPRCTNAEGKSQEKNPERETPKCPICGSPMDMLSSAPLMMLCSNRKCTNSRDPYG